MNVFLYIVFSLILLTVVMQFIFLFFDFPLTYNKHKRQKRSDKVYEKEVAELGDKLMSAVKMGKVKKQLLSNDAQQYNSNNALKHYVTFVDQSSIYKRIVSIEDGKFYG